MKIDKIRILKVVVVVDDISLMILVGAVELLLTNEMSGNYYDEKKYAAIYN